MAKSPSLLSKENPPPPASPLSSASPPILPAPPPGHESAGEYSQSAASPIDPAAVRSGAAFDEQAGIAASDPAPIGEAPPAPAPIALLEFDAWFSLMHGAFGMAAALTKLQSLAWAKDNPAARPAFKALYDTCSEIPALHFLLRPAGKWMERALTVGMFFGPMIVAARAELAARRTGIAVGASANDKAPPVEKPETAQVLPAAFVAAVGKAA